MERSLKPSDLTEIPHQILEEAVRAGIEKDDSKRAGTLMHVDRETIYTKINEKFRNQIEFMDVKDAIKKYPWVDDYRWKIVDRDKDEYTRKVAEDFSGGYFIHVKENADITFPLQACLMMAQKEIEQKIYNIIIVEEGANVNIISTCVQHSQAKKASHLGITEYFLKKDSYLNFTMVHSWSEDTFVRPRSAAVLDDGAVFISNYLSLRPAKDVQMYPVAYCNGKGSKASINSILYGHTNTKLDIGSAAILNGPESAADMISRAISRNGSEMILRGRIEAHDPTARGHLECKGLLLDEKSFIHSIPELIASKGGAELSHEASVGKISDKEISYLMTRRMSEEDAISMIIRGFMDVGILGLPPQLEKEVDKVIDLTADAS